MPGSTCHHNHHNKNGKAKTPAHKHKRMRNFNGIAGPRLPSTHEGADGDRLPPASDRPTLPGAPTVRMLALDAFFQLVGVMTVLAVAGNELSDARHAHDATAGQLGSSSGDGWADGSSPPAGWTRAASGGRGPARPKGNSGPARTFKRLISSSTVLRSLHVTQAMSDCLGLHGGGGGGGADEDGAMARDKRPVFRRALTLRDTAGQAWPIVFEASTSCRQYHPRFSHGWSVFCQAHGVRVGDIVEFRRMNPACDEGGRRVAHPEGDTMGVRVLRRSSSG